MNRNTLMLVVALSLILILYGCTSSKYVPCCVKDKIYNSTTGQILPNPACRFQNDTLFGPCSTTMNLPGVANCTDTAGTPCSSILNPDDCSETSTCIWNESASPKCQGGTAYWFKPICVDDIPKSCVNNRCTAMMCGFSDLAPSPPPSSQDWDIEKYDENSQKQVPNSEAAAPLKINLQGTSCTFETMNNKLFKTVQNSKGSLWVNSFRFGVGRSFSDFDASRYFFPATDALCNINPKGTIDRFSVYLNEPTTLCANVSSYYRCSLNNLNFTTADICQAYCDGNASRCSAVTGQKPACQSTKFVYNSKEECKASCSVMSDPSLCTTNNTVAPFLESDARYKLKYVADYYISAKDPWGDEDDDETITRTCKDVDSWITWPEPDTGPWCDDTYPWDQWTNGALKGYYENRKSPQLQFDYDYYAKQLTQQYVNSGYNPNYTFPFECKDSVECMSGSCDQTYYSRGLCTSNSGTIDCGCTVKPIGQSLTPTLSCQDIQLPYQMVAKKQESPEQATHGEKIIANVNDLMFLGEHEFSRNSTAVNFQYYYQENDSDVNMQPKLFKNCGVAPNATRQKKCVYTAQFWTYDDLSGDEVVPVYSTPYTVITDASGGACPALPNGNANPAKPANYSFYNITFTKGQTKFGNCEFDPEKMGFEPKTPYLNITKRGWCAACTYSTLAVQKISAGDPGGPAVDGQTQGGFEDEWATCLHWRGEWSYNTTTGRYGDVRNPSVPKVTRDPSGYKQAWYDGTISRYWYDNDDVTWGCLDGWTGGWGWGSSSVIYPSLPYMRDQLRSYLQSNIMPVLDERDFKTSTHIEDIVTKAECTYDASITSTKYYCWGYEGPYTSSNCDLRCNGEDCKPKTTNGGYTCNTDTKIYDKYLSCYYGCEDIHTPTPTGTDYTPKEFCTSFGAGSSIHVIADTGLLKLGPNQGSAFLDNTGKSDLINYLGLPFAADGNYTGFDGRTAAIVRADFMKTQCTTPPLVGLAINPADSSLSTLVGTGDLLEPSNPNRGLLHKFFYNGSQPQYIQRVGRGTPDPYPGKFDLFLQEWVPTCPSGIIAEIEGRMNYSRALLSNFSRPSLIWRFHFNTTNNNCKVNGSYNAFMEALFNKTGAFVDSGIIGIIYDAWGTESGRGYGSPTYGGTYTGLSQTLATGALEGAGSKTTTPFCAVQKNSKAVLGITKFTYGQRIYADSRTCGCTKCTASDYALGLCDRSIAAPGSPDEPQLYCADGTTCAMPPGETNYSAYRCPSNCVDADVCKICATDFPSNTQSYCRIEQVGEPVQVAYRNYSELDDATASTDWEFIAGLPLKDKCCVIKNASDTIPTMYTYVSRKGTKQRSEFIQYPTRGETGLDCGRTPDTSVLSYCGITIPISQKDIMCFRSG
ncbi:MAG: hypothetical protein QW568_01745 [Candidatus Anstonellaceae archaeon]